VTLATREIHVGDCRALLREIPDDSIHCVVTSPPYWGLRDYGVADQIGLEATPEEYMAELVAVFREVRRALRPDGTLWLNLGDCYATGAAILRKKTRALRDGSHAGKHTAMAAMGPMTQPNRIPIHGLKPKDMVGIPWRVAFALQADGWYLRCDIIWSKPNQMPEAVTDRPTKAHEFVFLLSKSERYYYDAAAIKEPVTGRAHPRGDGVNPKAGPKDEGRDDQGLKPSTRFGRGAGFRVKQNASFSGAIAGLVDERNKRSVWTIATEPYGGAHFATFPRKLVETCILAGCPAGGIVLDPFGGSGTVGQVSEALGRQWILIELSPEYAQLARARTAQRGLFC